MILELLHDHLSALRYHVAWYHDGIDRTLEVSNRYGTIVGITCDCTIVVATRYYDMVMQEFDLNHPCFIETFETWIRAHASAR